MEESQPLVLYHANCNDGFTAAWAFWQHYPEWEYVPVGYQEPKENFVRLAKNREVYMLDFSFKHAGMVDLIYAADSVAVIDHHETAQAEIGPLEADGALTFIYDVSKSGAMLAWEFVNPEKAATQAPDLVKYVQDRDLWKFELEGSNEVHAALGMIGMTFDNWELISRQPIQMLINNGNNVLMVREKDMKRIIGITKRVMGIGGWSVPTVNSAIHISELGNILAQKEGAAFGAVYYDDKHGRKFSLRSVGEFNVATIAGYYGGGGHKNAAGFSVKGDHELANR